MLLGILKISNNNEYSRREKASTTKFTFALLDPFLHHFLHLPVDQLLAGVQHGDLHLPSAAVIGEAALGGDGVLGSLLVVELRLEGNYNQSGHLDILFFLLFKTNAMIIAINKITADSELG